MKPCKKINLSLAISNKEEIESESTDVRQISVVEVNDRPETNQFNSFGAENENMSRRQIPKHMTRAEIKLEAVRVSNRRKILLRTCYKSSHKNKFCHKIITLWKCVEKLKEGRRLMFYYCSIRLFSIEFASQEERNYELRLCEAKWAILHAIN